MGLACAGDRCRVASSLRVWMPPSRPLLPTVLPGCVQQQVAGVGAVGSPACAAPLPASLGHVSLPLEEREQRQLPVFQSCPPAPPPSLWPTPAHTQQASFMQHSFGSLLRAGEGVGRDRSGGGGG